MKLTDEMIEILLTLEERIGNSCYNPHSYDGWNKVQGKEFRYFPTYQVGEGDSAYLMKGYTLDSERINPQNFETLHYRFGANHLYVGDAILGVMEILEERYGLDFNALEAKWRQEHPEEDDDE